MPPPGPFPVVGTGGGSEGDLMKTRVYGKTGERVDVPNLMELQVRAYERFLQRDIPPSERDNVGLEAILREIFPIKSYDGKLSLEFIGYELGRPRYMPEECRELRARIIPEMMEALKEEGKDITDEDIRAFIEWVRENKPYDESAYLKR